MCGRFVISDTTPDLIALFDIEVEGDDLPGPSWNVRPTDQIPLVLESNKGGTAVRRLESARWSLVPRFSKQLSSKYPTFNARSETAAEKASFADSVRTKRAIIPAAGYYEWHTVGKAKTPYFVYPREEPGLFAFAALYSWWKDPERPDDDPKRWVLSSTMLTCQAEGQLADIHERTPVMLPSSFWNDWLDPGTVGDHALVEAAVAASRAVAGAAKLHEVAPLKGNGPELIDPADPNTAGERSETK